MKRRGLTLVHAARRSVAVILAAALGCSTSAPGDLPNGTKCKAVGGSCVIGDPFGPCYLNGRSTGFNAPRDDDDCVAHEPNPPISAPYACCVPGDGGATVGDSE